MSAFKDAGCQIETFTPAKLRQHLADNKPLGVELPNAPKASLHNRLWIVNMLRYCISDNCQDLRGLPLAILANETLQVFGYNQIGTIYIGDNETRIYLPIVLNGFCIQIYIIKCLWIIEWRDKHERHRSSQKTG